MGAESSAQRDGKSQEDASASASASAGELSAEVNVLQEGSSALDSKPLQKNGQISSLTSLNGNSEDNTLAEVGQPDGVSVAQKEETPETMDTIQDEVAPQVNGEKVEKESPDDNDISAVEEKAAEEKPDDASEVGFKKIFRFVGFKFTLKKDKSEEKDPVKLLTVKDKEEVSGADEPTKEAEAATAEEKSTAEEKEADTEASTEAEAEVIKDSEKAETTDAPAEGTAAEATDEAVKEEGAEKEGETTPPSQESTMSPFRKLFSGGLFSNLRKKASVKKTKEEEDKEAAVEEKTAKTEEIAAAVEEKEEKDEVEQETKEAAPATPEEEKTEPKEAAPATPEEEKTEPKEAAPATPEEEKTEPKEVAPATSEEEKTEPKEVAPATSEEEKTEPKEAAAATSEEEKTEPKEAAAATSEEEKTEPKEEAPATPEEEKTEPKEEAPATPEEVKSENTPEPEVTVETSAPAATTTDETKQEEEKAEPSAEEEKAPAEVTSEAELLSSQEKVKPQGSPLKKLFAGAGLKKLSSKKQKTKKDAETKLTESGEQSAEQLQSSTESAEAPKADSGPSSPEESGEHVIAVEVTQNESSQETEGEVASDGEKKKEGIIAWSSFKKLVTPKKRVKRSSESEDEATGEKPAKSATLSSSESAALADKSVEEEAKEDKPTEEEPKTENTEKLVSSTEEPKKKMDTSVSWEALMCMGGPKKRTRRTSDSDDEETKVEEEPAAAVEGEQEGKTEAAIVTSLTTESEGEGFSSPDPLSSPPERESAWDTLKRMVMSKNKAKLEEKLEESGEHVQSDSEASKDESSFSLRKFLPGRRKKKAEKQASTEQGSGEEDSDTPAVVPLSEYDEQVESEQEAPQEPAVVQIKVSAEDRSPSWIPAVVEDIDDKHDELSDIPEEAENPATPKSVDTDIAEDETEEEEAALPPKALGRTGRRLSTAEVKPVAPAPAAETTPVPQGPKPESAAEVIGSIETQISEIALKTSVAVEDVPIEVASEKTEFEPETVIAESKTVTTLAPHAGDEAMAICTGLGTKEIAKVALEKPAMPVIECVAVIRDALSTEVLKEEKPTCPEEATAAKDEAFKAQVHQVETTELELAVETCKMDIEAASETVEPESEKVGIVSTVPEESEVIQPTTMNDNSPKTVVVNPITPTSETAVCAQSVEVTEPTVEAKEVKMDMELRAAIEENTEVVQDVNEESITMATEPVVVPSEEVPVITEAVVLVAPVSAEPDQVETPDVVTVENASLSEPVVENASLSEPVADEPVQMQETKEEGTVVETVEATVAQTAESEISEVIEQTSEKMEEIKEDEQQASEFEAQSMVIAQAVIQDAMDKVSEDAPEPKKPTTPTATMPEPVQAVATKEKEMEIATETPVITDAPATVLCEKPAPKPLCVAVEVIDTIPVEVTESLDASVEEEKKPEEGLKEAVEVKVSEETVTVEEVVEIKAESQVEEEQSKEDTEVQEPDVKEAAEEVKPQPEEAKSDAPSEENKEKTLEIHMPVQVVLQTAQVIEEPTVEEEAVVEFDNNGPVAEDEKAASAESGTKLSTLSEEPQETDSAEVSAPSQVTEAAASQPETEKTSSVKCAEVMAQVIEVIEEAVKEIEPVSTEITAAS